MNGFTIDAATPLGARTLHRLRVDELAWFTTVGAKSGVPQPVPVWFLWDEKAGSALIYSKPDVPKLANLRANPGASLHFDGNGSGGDIAVLTGHAAPSNDPPSDAVPGYVTKYATGIAENGWTPASLAADYSVALRFTPSRLRGH